MAGDGRNLGFRMLRSLADDTELVTLCMSAENWRRCLALSLLTWSHRMRREEILRHRCQLKNKIMREARIWG